MATSNEVKITGRIIETKPVRYTPAGVPVLEFSIEHQSTVIEAELARQISFSSSAIVVGQLSAKLQAVPLGQLVSIFGFLATSKKGSSKLRIHVQSFELINESLM